MSGYRTVVADPPWAMPTRGGYSWRRGRRSGAARELDYPPMDLGQIAEIGVSEMAAADAHLWLWVPTRYLEAAFTIVRDWGFPLPPTTLVWSKAPRGFNPGGDFASVAEFLIYAKRGKARAKRKVEQQVFTWPRQGDHSTKPDQFYDLVESVSHGPYLELFQRRGRLGWDAAGNEALSTVEVAGVRNA